jgi:phage/plasmid-like protein (TIGR03299 family)
MHQVDTAAFYKVGAWHGLGEVGEFTPDEMADKVLNYTVEKHPAYAHVVADDGMRILEIPGRYGVVRTDRLDSPDAVLGWVGEQYQLFQPRDLHLFMKALLDRGDLIYESTLSLFGGRVNVICARRPEALTIAGDEHVAHVLALNSHDRKHQLSIRPVMTRVVCNNTLNVALRENHDVEWGIRHTGALYDRVEHATEALQLSWAYERDLAVALDQLAEQPYTEGQFEAMVDHALPVVEGEDRKRKHPNTTRRIEAKRSYWASDTVSDSLRPTKLGAFNVFTEWAEHSQTLRGDRKRAPRQKLELRFASATFGGANSIAAQRQRAFSYLTR